jgi:hypothetical protein
MTRGVADNDPGNIRKSPTHWLGEIAGTDPAFETFDTPEHGIRALAKVLLAYQRVHGLRTVAEIINRWAPTNENDTAAYIADVAARLATAPDAPLDLTDPATLSALVTAIIRHENGAVPYFDETIAAGVGMALA